MAIGRGITVEVTIPAAVAGWNARDPWPMMKPAEAIQLDNLFPDADGVRLRRGYEQHATGTGPVNTLHAFRYAGFQKLLAYSQNNIWDITNPGPAVSLDNAITSSVWSVTNFGAYAIMVNGIDTPRKYDGASVTTTAFTGTGLVPENLYGVVGFKNRLFFWEQNSLKFWYGATQAIAGALNDFDLSYVSNLGGKIVAIGDWSIDSGEGMDDALAIILSSGQVLIYQGTDPGDANAWALKGIFEIGEPVSSRCLVKFAGDLIVMTADGYTPLSRALSAGRTTETVQLSDRISGAVKEAVREQKDAFGWQGILYPRGGYLLFNVPQSTGTPVQHVMNTQTRSWCRFTSQPAQCWAVHDDEIYFGAPDGVYKADTGNADNGVEIQFDMRTAFAHMASPGRRKRWTMARATLQVSGSIPLAMRLATDYASLEPLGAVVSGVAPGSLWDVSYWDEDPLNGPYYWAPGAVIEQRWASVTGIGYVASLWLRGRTATQDIKIFAIDYLLEPGGVL